MTTFEDVEPVVLYGGRNDGQITDAKRDENGLPKVIPSDTGEKYNLTDRKDSMKRTIYQWEGIKN